MIDIAAIAHIAGMAHSHFLRNRPVRRFVHKAVHSTTLALKLLLAVAVDEFTTLPAKAT